MYPAPAYLCITNLLRLRHHLIFHQWWHLSLQILCRQQGPAGPAPMMPAVVRHHVVPTHTAQMVLFRQTMCIPAQVVQM